LPYILRRLCGTGGAAAVSSIPSWKEGRWKVFLIGFVSESPKLAYLYPLFESGFGFVVLVLEEVGGVLVPRQNGCENKKINAIV